MAAQFQVLPPDRLKPLLHAHANAARQKRRSTLLFVGCLAAACIASGWVVEIDLGRLADNLGRFFSYFGRIFRFDASTPAYVGQPVVVAPLEWFWGWRKWLSLLADTLLIAYVGTLLGSIGGFLLSFLCVRNLMPNRLARGTAKRFLEFSRTVPEIVFALVFVIAFGLGAIPGVLAIAIHTMGALGKLFSEVIENIDMKPVEGVTAAGGSWLEVVRFGVVPQVLSNFASYALLRFEINVRGAAVMGFVGAGGIGQDLIEAIRKFYYTDVSAILVLIIVTIMIIDLLTERLRNSLMGRENGR
jgi:phosphonate transport system permease protein